MTLTPPSEGADVDAVDGDTPPVEAPRETPAAKKLGDFIRSRFRELSSDRQAEDATWFISGLFDLTVQWLQREDGSRKLKPLAPNGWTLPVSDHFSKTIAANANSLGANLPRVTALSGNYDARSRRAAAYAEAVFDTANKESGMDILNPILARQTVNWGIAWTKEAIAFDRSTEDIPIMAEPTPMGNVAVPGKPAQLQPDNPAAPPPEQVNDATGLPSDTDQQDAPVVGSERIPAPRLRTTLPSPFAVYIPRDSSDANSAREYYERVPYTLGEGREMFPKYAASLSADGSGVDASGDTAYADSTSASLAALYESQLRRIGGALSSASGSGSGAARQNGTTATQDQDSSATVEMFTCIEGWVEWSRLPRGVQRAIEAEWGDSPSEVEDYAKRGMSKISAAMAFGVYATVWQDCTLQWGENPNSGDSPYTAFMWEKAALNPYGKGGLGVVLVPLQRQLNRLDALADRQLMSTGTTKILMPESQQYKQPPGDPVDVWEYDDAVGKHAPQLVPAGNSGWIPQKRAQIVAEFQQLGYTEGVQSGQNPAGVDSFRGIAYLGAKAEEQRGTQRALWEQSHEERDKKILRLAKRVWTEPRKIKVAGPNNRYGAELIEGADLDFETDQLSIVEGSSKPKTLAEKTEALQALMLMPGFIDPSDPEFQQIVLDSIGMQDVKLQNSLQFSKADRDLQQLLDGVQPVSSPFQDWNIVIRVISEYTLTEEYEGLPANVQAGILGYAQWAQELGAGAAMPPQQPGAPGPQLPGQAKDALAGMQPAAHPSQTLGKKSPAPGAAQIAAQSQGNQVASQVDSNAGPHFT